MSAPDVDELIQAGVAEGQGSLSEHESKFVLAAYGVPVVEEELVSSEADAMVAAERIGYPVAVKACGPDLLHKTDRGLVVLDVDGPAELASAILDIDRALGEPPADGYLVQRMVNGRRELIVGAVRDQSFGPCVMLGLGGILVEAVGDVAFRLVPIDERDAREMVGELKAQSIFGEFRGEPTVIKESVGAILVAAGRMLADHPRIAQVDINPLIVSRSEPVAVDALITLAEVV